MRANDAHDCELVSLLAHGLDHHLMRKKDGPFHLYFHSPGRAAPGSPEDRCGATQTSETARALAVKSGCAAEIAVMGALIE